jgi:N-acetylglutamate synthase-like GNAT family acetyltransferase
MDFKVRRARPQDVPAIAALINHYYRKGELLPRSADAIRASLDDWWVAVRGGRVVACGSLVAYSPSLSELRSLAVVPEAHGQGLGSAITQALIEEAARRRVGRLFALTRAAPFFIRLGFQPSEKEQFPEKVWRDCALCPIQDRCDEVAVAMDLNGRADDPPAGAK